MSTAITGSSNQCRGHDSQPTGGTLQAPAISWAPSLVQASLSGGCRRERTAGMSPSPPACHAPQWPGAALGAPAAALSATIQRGGPVPPSAWYSMRAWSGSAATHPVPTSVHDCARASGTSRTTSVPIHVILWGVLLPSRTATRTRGSVARVTYALWPHGLSSSADNATRRMPCDTNGACAAPFRNTRTDNGGGIAPINSCWNGRRLRIPPQQSRARASTCPSHNP
jgi:hypothetical protein